MDHSYVCPDCRTGLEGLYCRRCDWEFPCADGIPRLLPREEKFAPAVSIARAYDTIYTEAQNVWENQGRTPEFLGYFSGLLSGLPGGRYLEIGCGEGFLLSSLRNGEKFGVDLSLEAMRRARARAPASYSVALAERLPFPASHFDLIASVGVMEHFLDIPEALGEIRRVLKPGGHYVSLTHVDVTVGERIGMKISEFVYPRPRPVGLARWLARKLKTAVQPAGPGFVQQPIQNRYTTRGAQAWLAGNGFHVVEVVHNRRDRALPLAGPWVVIYIARKRPDERRR